MYNELKEWIESLLSSQFLDCEYQYSFGEWTDDESLGFVCAIYGMGGAAVDMDVRRPRFRVLLVGPKASRHQAHALINHVNQLIQLTIDSDPPCGAASIRALSEPAGPGYTTENRAWVSVDFQIIY